jgi:hypothetical protein
MGRVAVGTSIPRSVLVPGRASGSSSGVCAIVAFGVFRRIASKSHISTPRAQFALLIPSNLHTQLAANSCRMASTAMRCQAPRTFLGRAQRASTRAVPLSTFKRCRHACAATLNEQEPAADSSNSNSTPGNAEPSKPYTRTFKALGMEVIESTESFPEPEKDFWSSGVRDVVLVFAGISSS